MRICVLGDAGHVNLISWTRYMAGKGGNDVHVVTFNRPIESVQGVTFHVLDGFPSRWKIRYLFHAGRIARILETIRPDILIGYRVTSYGYMAVKTRFRPVVLVAQGSDLFYRRNRMLTRGHLRRVLSHADLVQTWAPHMKEAIRSHGIADDRILAIPKGVDTDLFNPDGRSGEGPRVLISTRQLRGTYNHACVLQAVRMALTELPDLEYHVCGEGEYRSVLESLAGTLGIASRVVFRGKVLHEDLPGVLKSAGVYVSMQGSDGVSSSLLEAMACGVFPIVTDIPANRLWVEDGVNGFLVPPDDDGVLARKIVEAFHGEGLRREAGRINAALVAEKASMRRNFERMEAEYRRLAGIGEGSVPS